MYGVAVLRIFLPGLRKVLGGLQELALAVVGDSQFVIDPRYPGAACCQRLELGDGFIVLVLLNEGAGGGQRLIFLLSSSVDAQR